MFDNKSERKVQKAKQHSHIFYGFCVNIRWQSGGGGPARTFPPHQQLCSNYSKQQSSSRAWTCHTSETMLAFNKILCCKADIKKRQTVATYKVRKGLETWVLFSLKSLQESVKKTSNRTVLVTGSVIIMSAHFPSPFSG